MATYSIDPPSIAIRKTLTAGQIDTITVNRPTNGVYLMNVDGADAIYFSIDGSDPSATSGTADVLPASVSALPIDLTYGSGAVIKLVSPSAVKYSVRAR